MTEQFACPLEELESAEDVESLGWALDELARAEELERAAEDGAELL